MPDAWREEPDADFIQVGHGSAGSVLADRLSESGAHRVAVIEPDHSTAIHLFMSLPFLNFIDNPKINWRMASLPVPSLGGRVINYPQGKVAGGTGSINGMLYVRSHRAEHDHWVEAGCAGWSSRRHCPSTGGRSIQQQRQGCVHQRRAAPREPHIVGAVHRRRGRTGI